MHPNRKGKNQTFTIQDDMIPYAENLEDSTKKLLELIHKLSKLVGYKIKIQKSVAFLYIKNETAVTEIKDSIPFTIAPKRTKYLGRNLTKEVKNLYSENYKTQTNGKLYHAHGLEEQILLKCPYYSKQSAGVMQLISKYQQHISQN